MSKNINHSHKQKYFKKILTLVIAFVAVASFAMLRPTRIIAAAPSITEYAIPTSSAQSEKIVTGPDGNLWFTEAATNKVAKVTTSGTVTEYAVPTSSSRPAGLTVGPDGNLWFTELNANKVAKVTTSGTFTEYTVPTSTSSPLDITKGPDGNLWFTENAVNKVAKVTTSGTFTEYTLAGGSGPGGITAGPDGNLWFLEISSNKVAKITTSGTVTEYAVPTGSANLFFITTGSDDNLWFTENGVDKIGKVTTSGTVSEYTLASGAAPSGIVNGPDGNLWFTEYGLDKIGEMSTSGTVLNQFAIPSSVTSPYDINNGPDGNLWFTEYTANNVGKLTMPLAPGISNSSVTAVTGKAKVFNLFSGVANNPAASTLSIVSGPSHGVASVNTTDGTLTYTSTAGYTGSDSITYKLCSADDNGQCASAVLGISVTASAPNTGFGVYTANPLRTLALTAFGAAGLFGLVIALRKHQRSN